MIKPGFFVKRLLRPRFSIEIVYRTRGMIVENSRACSSYTILQDVETSSRSFRESKRARVFIRYHWLASILHDT